MLIIASLNRPQLSKSGLDLSKFYDLNIYHVVFHNVVKNDFHIKIFDMGFGKIGYPV